MRRYLWLFVVALAMLIHSPRAGAQAPEKCFKNMPPGCRVTRSVVLPKDQRQAISKKLGVAITGLSNTDLVLHGATIRANLLDGF